MSLAMVGGRLAVAAGNFSLCLSECLLRDDSLVVILYVILRQLAGIFLGYACQYIPLILNFAVTAAFIPSTVPQINYEIYNHVYFGAMWADLFYTHPALYVTLYILLDGLFAGLIALIGYAFSFYITNQFAAAAFPLLLFWGIDYLSGLLARAIPGAKWSYEISPIAYLHPATLRYDPNAAIILIEAVMLFCSAIAIIFKRGVWHE